ncbi:hypothetical protein PAMP_022987 [Pampus punctatissimus]
MDEDGRTFSGMDPATVAVLKACVCARERRSPRGRLKKMKPKSLALREGLKLLTAHRTRQDTTRFCMSYTNPGPDPTRKMLLDLEYQARRAYIDSDVMKEQDRPTTILQAYPCFREVDHIMDELQRILNQGNSHFIPELKNRWWTFCEKAQFYGVFKKVMRPPLSNKVEKTIAMIKALFPSPIAPPKKLGHASEVCGRPQLLPPSKTTPQSVVIMCETNCILAICTVPVLVFPKEDIADSVMYDVM